MIKAVLDTNVVVSAQLNEEGPPGLILKLALSRFFRLFVSEPLLLEYMEVLAQPPLGFGPQHLTKWVRNIRRIATLVHPRRTLSVARDPGDDKILECALEVKADFIVTGNIRHFPNKFQGIRVVAPRLFLTILASEPRQPRIRAL
jgi:uncharacterized protein